MATLFTGFVGRVGSEGLCVRKDIYLLPPGVFSFVLSFLSVLADSSNLALYKFQKEWNSACDELPLVEGQGKEVD